MRTEPLMLANMSEGVVIVNARGIVEGLTLQARALLSSVEEPLVGQSIVDVLDGAVAETILEELSERFHLSREKRAGRARIVFASPLFMRCEALPSAGVNGWLIMLSTSQITQPWPAVSFHAWSWRRFGVIGATATALLVVAVVFYADFIDKQPQSQQAMTATERSVTIPATFAGSLEPRKRLSQLSIVGTFEASETVSVIAPFDGVIKDKGFDFDAEVEQGQALLTLDPSELHQRIQEAKISMLKAEKTVRELENWDTGGEIARAKRISEQSRQQVEQTERKLQEADTLLKKGIIPRSEYDGMTEQLSGFKIQLATASDDLLATQEKASKNNREIARIEYGQARVKFDDLMQSLTLGRIVAPRSGILSKAAPSSGQTPATLDVGSRVTKGQLLFNIALTGKLRVYAKVDEVDVVDLIPGMPVEISIDSQDMQAIRGRLAGVSAQAAQSGNGLRSAVFDIRIDLPELSEHQRRRLRVGMSCNVSIDTGKTGNSTLSLGVPPSGGPRLEGH